MQLREGEQILKIYHHHPTPFILNVIKVITVTLPFFLLLFVFKNSLSSSQYALAFTVVILIFIGVLTYISLIYWLDRLVITNFRVVHDDWKFLTVRDEAEGMLSDIQDIATKEKGVLSYFKFFDYGSIKVETASSKAIILFEDAPDPEGIRKFIYHVRQQ